MCRFTLYMGPKIRLSTLLVEPEHSLIRQSVHANERDEPLNGDGFGVGWFAPEYGLEPAVFRSITPAWNNRNLHNLSRVIGSGCILAHVRAASQLSGVNEANCHPFRWKNLLFMHNGDVADFAKVRRKILETVSDEAFNNVFGSTDSEHIFAVIIDELLRRVDEKQNPGLRLAHAMQTAIYRIVDICKAAGIQDASYLNLAVSDGNHAVICRYCSDSDEQPESLYYLDKPNFYKSDAEGTQMRRRGDAGHAVLIASERLTDDPSWQEIPANHLLLVERDQPLRIFNWDEAKVCAI